MTWGTLQIDLFAGFEGLRIAFQEAYSGSIEEAPLNRLTTECFDEMPASALNSRIHPSQEEYHSARHLADMDILEQFCTAFVRYHRDYKYCRGKSDTANHVLRILSESGIFISAGKYNNWRRSKNYRLIDDESLDSLLELLKVTPSEFKRLIYAHIMARREIKESDRISSIAYTLELPVHFKESRLSRIKLSRPPCGQAA